MNNNETITSSDAMYYAWEKLQEGLGLFLCYYGIALGPWLFAYLWFEPSLGLCARNVMAALFWVTPMLLTPGLHHAMFKLARGETPHLPDFFFSVPAIVSWLACTVAQVLLLLPYLLLYLVFIYIPDSQRVAGPDVSGWLMVPAVGAYTFLLSFLYMRLSLYTCFIADKGMNPVSAFIASWKATEGSESELFTLIFAQVLVTVSGFIALGVGLFVALPVVSLSWVYAYEKLTTEPTPILAPASAVQAPKPPLMDDLEAESMLGQTGLFSAQGGF